MRWDEQTAERKRCKNMRKQPAASWRRLWGASFSWRSCQASRFWLVRSRDDFNPAILYQEPVPCISNKSFCASVSKFNLCTFHLFHAHIHTQHWPAADVDIVWYCIHLQYLHEVPGGKANKTSGWCQHWNLPLRSFEPFEVCPADQWRSEDAEPPCLPRCKRQDGV